MSKWGSSPWAQKIDFPQMFSQKYTCRLRKKWKSIFTWRSSLSWRGLTKWKERDEMETPSDPEVCYLTSHRPCNFCPALPVTPVPCTFTLVICFAKLPIFPSSCWKEETQFLQSFAKKSDGLLENCTFWKMGSEENMNCCSPRRRHRCIYIYREVKGKKHKFLLFTFSVAFSRLNSQARQACWV